MGCSAQTDTDRSSADNRFSETKPDEDKTKTERRCEGDGLKRFFFCGQAESLVLRPRCQGCAPPRAKNARALDSCGRRTRFRLVRKRKIREEDATNKLE